MTQSTSSKDQSSPKPSLSVVVSFYNEQNVLAELISRLRTVLTSQCEKGALCRYELIFVNDASTDSSLDILLEAAKEGHDIRVINMSRNFGVTPCVLAGMKYSHSDLVVYLDADLQDPPEIIPQLIAAHNDTGAEVVHTVRDSRAGESWFKLSLTKFAYKLLRTVSAVSIIVEAGDFKLLSRRAVNEIIAFNEKKPFMRGLVSWIGFRQTQVRYDRMPRHAGNTKFPVTSRRVIRNFLDSALISFSDVLLQISTAVGFTVSFCAIVLLIYVLVERILGHNIPGWSAIMVTVLFLGGIQMLFMGILGLYINAIFLESKGRPNYIVESLYGFNKTSKTQVDVQALSQKINPRSDPSSK